MAVIESLKFASSIISQECFPSPSLWWGTDTAAPGVSASSSAAMFMALTDWVISPVCSSLCTSGNPSRRSSGYVTEFQRL
ncbi:hypothetical protein RRG08_015423 [Elysia crispata]|uniref:Uncharacterized protein n=1 Tax=Elysia crispata TaxID=231223 RepID=A0AAE1CZD6_9GAST|nr:hypothetical protein RRG08_015423 [Elysia crispata]